jgi:hypothetical protein
MNKNKQLGFTLYEIFVAVLILACIYGWVANIVKMATVINDSLTGLVILRIIGIFVFPLGVILGYV